MKMKFWSNMHRDIAHNWTEEELCKMETAAGAAKEQLLLIAEAVCDGSNGGDDDGERELK